MPQCVVIIGKPVMTGHCRVRRSLSFKTGNALNSTADFEHEKIWTNSVTIADDHQRCEARKRPVVNIIDITACSLDRIDSSSAKLSGHRDAILLSLYFSSVSYVKMMSNTGGRF